MELLCKMNNEELVINVIGRLDTNTSLDYENLIKEKISNINSLILDFNDLIYISSAGLRVVLVTKKLMNDKSMKIINCSKEVMNIFKMTGFDKILDISLKHDC